MDRPSPQSHLCDPSSIPVLAVSCGLSLLMVLALLRGFLTGFSGFPPSTKINTSKFQFDLGEGRRFVSVHTVTRLPSINKVIYFTADLDGCEEFAQAFDRNSARGCGELLFSYWLDTVIRRSGAQRDPSEISRFRNQKHPYGQNRMY